MPLDTARGPMELATPSWFGPRMRLLARTWSRRFERSTAETKGPRRVRRSRRLRVSYAVPAEAQRGCEGPKDHAGDDDRGHYVPHRGEAHTGQHLRVRRGR